MNFCVAHLCESTDVVEENCMELDRWTKRRAAQDPSGVSGRISNGAQWAMMRADPVSANSRAAFSADLHKHHLTAQPESHRRTKRGCSQRTESEVKNDGVALCPCEHSSSSHCPGFVPTAAWRADDLTPVWTKQEHHLMWFQKLL